jgi:gliding motility-associated-like protein
MDFMVFDRWGNKVFESQTQSKGWDGTNNGKPLTMGAYVWELTATLQDGTTIDKKGNVTLVR